MRFLAVMLVCLLPAPAFAALACAGITAPGLAYPDSAGTWRGLEIDDCQKLAKSRHTTAVFTPILQDSDIPPPAAGTILFAPAGDIPAGYTAGAVIYNDKQALMVPVWSRAQNAKSLANAYICVEPGSPEDNNLTAYFAAQNIPLREFVFQETDEMHDAYAAGRCDAITARISLLRGLRANASGDRQADRILPDNLGDNPIRAAAPTTDPDLQRLTKQLLEPN